MKTLATLTSSLALSVLLLTAQAQAPATSHDNPKPAKPTTKATAHAQEGKNLGQKLVQKSKPTDTVIPRKVRKE